MILIENGLVVDGTGKPAFPADVIVDGDRIADVLPRSPESTLHPSPITLHPSPSSFDQTIDATGCLVTPGFIDAHSHSDTYLLIEPDAPSKLSQGVTTEINGQCGGSCAPRYGAARLSSDWASMTYPSLAHAPIQTIEQSKQSEQSNNVQVGPTWRSLAEYRALFDQVRPAINTIQFIGHNTLRSSVIGYDALKATPETQREMERLLARELDDGGWGLTTGLIYQPGKYSDAAEVTALAKVAAARGGHYATHMRSEGDAILEAIDEVLDLVRATGIRAEISHLKTSGKRNWGKIDAVLDKMQGAIDEGLLLGSDRYPYCAAGTDLDVVFPDWAGVGGIVEEVKRLKDEKVKRRIVDEINAQDRDWSTVMIGGTWSDATRSFSGRTVAAILEEADALWKSPGELVCAILARDACRTGAFFFGMSEDNLQKIYERPWIVPGSDASLRAPWGPLGKDHPHPRAYGTMPRCYRLLTGRVEGHARICSREEAIARMTSVPAARFGITGRGVLRVGNFADIAVWREEDFRETATYTVSHAFSAGMEAVLVNGCPSYLKGAFTHNRAGRFLVR